MSDIESEYSTTSNPDPAKALREAWEAYKATLAPRPIEEAPSGQRIDVWTHWEGDMVVTRWPDCYVVDGVLKGPHGPMSRPPSKASIIGWTPVPVVSLPLPSMDGKSDE